MLISINIDLHGNRAKIVDINYQERSVSEWMTLFETKKCSIRSDAEVVSFFKSGLSLDFAPSEKLEMVALT